MKRRQFLQAAGLAAAATAVAKPAIAQAMPELKWRYGYAYALGLMLLVGMILYAMDGLIFLGFGLWLDLAFHAFALFNMYKGLQALNQMN